jgi:uncharacterized protein (DUF305 family)
MKAGTIVIALGAAAALSGAAIAQMNHGGHGAGHGAPGQAAAGPAAAAPSTRAYQEIAARMHKAMDIRYSDDADADFVRGMIPHHVAAVEMAKVVLQHGKDPEVRKLAEEVVKAQEAEIGMMREWLRKRGK